MIQIPYSFPLHLLPPPPSLSENTPKTGGGFRQQPTLGQRACALPLPLSASKNHYHHLRGGRTHTATSHSFLFPPTATTTSEGCSSGRPPSLDPPSSIQGRDSNLKKSSSSFALPLVRLVAEWRRWCVPPLLFFLLPPTPPPPTRARGIICSCTLLYERSGNRYTVGRGGGEIGAPLAATSRRRILRLSGCCFWLGEPGSDRRCRRRRRPRFGVAGGW